MAIRFGKSETETEQFVFGYLDQISVALRIPQVQLEGQVRHLITGDFIRPDGLLVFQEHTDLRCLSGRIFALEIKPDLIASGHLKLISELTEQSRSYVDSEYNHQAVASRVVDGCIVYPDLETILAGLQPDSPEAMNYLDANYKRGILDIHRRMLARQRIYELKFVQGGLEIMCANEWMIRFSGPDQFQVTRKNHLFRRKVGSDYC